VLIAEDDAVLARLDEALAAAAGCQVIGIVPDGNSAIARASEADVLILDYQLEGPRTGLDVLSEVRARAYNVKVIVTTAHGSERVAAESLRLGADDYLMKDAAFTELLPTVLRRVLRLREMERQLADAQAAVVIAQRKAAIGEIIVAVSHEMNNPLMAVRAELELMKLDAASLSPRMQTGVTSAIIQLDRISAVLKKLANHVPDASVRYVGGTRMTDLSR
jgi:DNA-binding NarL/FixJ family response regulator